MRLYIGNIPFNTTEAEVRTHFSSCGVVTDVKLLTDRETGRPRGFGFVEMDDAGAQRAIADLNRTEFGGRMLVVNEARERASGGHRQQGRGRD